MAESNWRQGDSPTGVADYGYGTDRPAQADIPPQPAPSRTGRGGLAAGAIALFGLLLKVPSIGVTIVSTVLTQFRSFVLILIVLVGALSTWQRFRSTASDPSYYQVPAFTKLLVGGVYLVLLLGLALGADFTQSLLPARVG